MSSIQFTRPLNQIEQTKKYSNWKKSNVQFQCFKKNLWDQVRMFSFRTSSIEFGHRTKWNSLQKNTSGTKSSSWSSVETAKAIWSFVSFLQWNLYVTALCLSGQFSKSRFFAHTNTIFVTCIRRPPLLRGRWQPKVIFLCHFYLYYKALILERTETKPYVILCYFKLATFTL